MLKESEKGFITLIRSGIQNCYLSLPQDFSIDSIFVAAKEFNVINIVYNGAVNCGFDTNLPVMKKLFSLALRETVVDQRQLEEYKKLSDELLKENIAFLPLKGILLKSMYPQTYFRCMNDVDILIKPSEYKQLAKVLTANGYEFYCESDHEFIWNKKSVLNLECHKSLIPSYDVDFYNYYLNIWDKIKIENKRYYLTDEDVFIYIFIHFVKHYRSCGIGIKHIIDIYLFLERKIDWAYIETEFAKLNILEFFNNVKDVIEYCFNGKQLSDKAEFILSYLLNSGEFGRKELGKLTTVLRNAVSPKYFKKNIYINFFKKTFPNLKYMRRKYKFLNKYVFLLPFAWFIRLFVAVFSGKYFKANEIDLQKVKIMEESLKYVGLSYNFTE